jgi:IstB-like ATP binding protein
VFSQRYERASTIVTSNLPFDEWTSVFGSERLTGALLDRLTHHVHILEMNGDSYASPTPSGALARPRPTSPPRSDAQTHEGPRSRGLHAFIREGKLLRPADANSLRR